MDKNINRLIESLCFYKNDANKIFCYDSSMNCFDANNEFIDFAVNDKLLLIKTKSCTIAIELCFIVRIVFIKETKDFFYKNYDHIILICKNGERYDLCAEWINIL